MSEDRIKRFLTQYSKPNTRSTYQTALFHFLDVIYGPQRAGRNVTAEEKTVYERLAERYFTEGRDYFRDLMDFTIAQADKPPIPAKAKIAGVKEWLIFHDVEFTQKELKQLRQKAPKGRTGRTAEHDITVPMLRQVLGHLDTKGRAFVLVLASSGMRIGEATKIDLDDVDLEATPATIVVRGETTKTGDQRTVFISDEARDAVNEWLKVRARYLESAQDRNAGLVRNKRAGRKATEDTRLFPFTDNNARAMWNRALEKAGLWSVDRSTNQTQCKVHGLRKFFRSQLALTCPVDIVEALMGHEGYLTNAYRRYTLEQLGEYYHKGEHHVTIQGGGDLKELGDKLQDTQAALKGYRGIIDKQEKEIVDLSGIVEDLSGIVEDLSGRLEALEDNWRIMCVFEEASRDTSQIELKDAYDQLRDAEKKNIFLVEIPDSERKIIREGKYFRLARGK